MRGPAALLFSAATLSMVLPMPAAAQDEAAPTRSGSHTVRVDIPAQPLDSALTTLADQTGLRILFSSLDVAGIRSESLAGSFVPAEALGRLLAGTGFTYRQTAASAYTLEPSPQADEGAIQLGTLRVGGGNLGQSRPGSAGGEDDPADRPYRTAGSSSYISQEDIQRFRGTSTGDIFKDIPGVISGMNRNGSALDINIRGISGMNRIKTTIDGSEQTTTSWRGYSGVDDRVFIDPDLIGGITVTKGPTANAGGIGAIGGSVQIRTLNAGDIVPEGERFAVRVRAGVNDNAVPTPDPFVLDLAGGGPLYQTRRTQKSSLFDFNNGFANIAVATRQDNFDIVAAFARRQSGNYVVGNKGRTTYERIWSNGSSSEADLSIIRPGEEAFNTSEDLSSGLIKATFYFGEDHTLQFGYSRYENDYGEMQPTMLNGDFTYRQTKLARTRTDTYTARYHWQPDNGWIDLRANAWLARVDTVLRYNSLPLDDDPIPTLSRNFGGDISNTSILDMGGGPLTLHYGATFSHERARSPVDDFLLVGVNGDRDIYGLFANAEWKPKHWLTIGAGTRLDGYRLADKSDPDLIPDDWTDPEEFGDYPIATFENRSGANVSFSANIVAEPWEGVQFYALRAAGYRPPSIRETGFSVSFLYPNPDLRPERASNYEIGGNFARDGVLFEGDKARFKIARFWNNYRDYISRVYMPAELQTIAYFTVENIDKVRFTGFEVSGEYDAGAVFVKGTLTHYDDVTFCQGDAPCGADLPNGSYTVNHIPPRFSATATLGVRPFGDHFELAGRVSRTTGRLFARQETIGFTNVGAWVPYTVVDLFADVKVTREFSVQLSAENLTDRYYIDALNNTPLPSPGRTIRAALTARF